MIPLGRSILVRRQCSRNRDNPCAEFSDCHSDEIRIGVLRPPFVKLCFYNVHQFPSMLQKLPDGCDVAALQIRFNYEGDSTIHFARVQSDL